MRVNENTAISTSGVLLVPYDCRHVPTYHGWMEDEALRTATASDRLTLDEEYANQVEWRAAVDKLTFIVCQPRGDDGNEHSVVAGIDDVPERMVGDINFFLYPWEEEEDKTEGVTLLYGEIDVMIARKEHRGRGFGRAAVTALLYYILQRQRQVILAETAGTGTSIPRLRRLVVKIQATNAASIGLFASLGFQQRGGINYFGEVELVQDNLDMSAPEGYSEREYVRAAQAVA